MFCKSFLKAKDLFEHIMKCSTEALASPGTLVPPQHTRPERFPALGKDSVGLSVIRVLVAASERTENKNVNVCPYKIYSFSMAFTHLPAWVHEFYRAQSSRQIQRPDGVYRGIERAES